MKTKIIRQTKITVREKEKIESLSKDILHQKFIEAALNLDASIVEPFIPEDMMLQDMDKYRFLAYLQGHFDSIWQKHPEDYRVEFADLKCAGCEIGQPLAGFEVFAGVELAPYEKFGYRIIINSEGNTTDIFICHFFKRIWEIGNLDNQSNFFKK